MRAGYPPNRSDVRLRRFVSAIIVLSCATIVAGCGSLDQVVEAAPKPEARLLGAGVRNLRLQSLDLVFDIEVSNPYGVSLPLVDVNYTVGSRGKQLLSGGIKPSGSVPANGTSVVQLPARLDLAALLKTLPGVQPGAVVPYDAKINVVVDAPLVGEFSLPLKRSGEVPVPKVPEISLVSFDISELGADEVNAEARLRIRNTNQFSMRLAAVRFDIALAGRNVTSTRLRSASRLAPGQTTILKVPLSFSPTAAAAGVLAALSGADAAYAISGRLDVVTEYGELALPFNERGQTALRRR